MMTTTEIFELVAAALLFAAGIWLYRRRASEDGSYGSQGAVILFVIGAILVIHGLGLLKYRPSQSEVERMQQ